MSSYGQETPANQSDLLVGSDWSRPIAAGGYQLKKDESGKKAAQVSSRHGNPNFANANLKDGEKQTLILPYFESCFLRKSELLFWLS